MMTSNDNTAKSLRRIWNGTVLHRTKKVAYVEFFSTSPFCVNLPSILEFNRRLDVRLLAQSVLPPSISIHKQLPWFFEESKEGQKQKVHTSLAAVKIGTDPKNWLRLHEILSSSSNVALCCHGDHYIFIAPQETLIPYFDISNMAKEFPNYQNACLCILLPYSTLVFGPNPQQTIRSSQQPCQVTEGAEVLETADPSNRDDKEISAAEVKSSLRALTTAGLLDTQRRIVEATRNTGESTDVVRKKSPYLVKECHPIASPPARKDARSISSYLQKYDHATGSIKKATDTSLITRSERTTSLDDKINLDVKERSSTRSKSDSEMRSLTTSKHQEHYDVVRDDSSATLVTHTPDTEVSKDETKKQGPESLATVNSDISVHVSQGKELMDLVETKSTIVTETCSDPLSNEEPNLNSDIKRAKSEGVCLVAEEGLDQPTKPVTGNVSHISGNTSDDPVINDSEKMVAIAEISEEKDFALKEKHDEILPSAEKDPSKSEHSYLQAGNRSLITTWMPDTMPYKSPSSPMSNWTYPREHADQSNNNHTDTPSNVEKNTETNAKTVAVKTSFETQMSIRQSSCFHNSSLQDIVDVYASDEESHRDSSESLATSIRQSSCHDNSPLQDIVDVYASDEESHRDSSESPATSIRQSSCHDNSPLQDIVDVYASDAESHLDCSEIPAISDPDSKDTCSSVNYTAPKDCSTEVLDKKEFNAPKSELAHDNSNGSATQMRDEENAAVVIPANKTVVKQLLDAKSESPKDDKLSFNAPIKASERPAVPMDQDKERSDSGKVSAWNDSSVHVPKQPVQTFNTSNERTDTCMKTTENADTKWKPVSKATENADTKWKPDSKATENSYTKWKPDSKATENTDMKWKPVSKASENADLKWTPVSNATENADSVWKPVSKATENADIKWKPVAKASENADAKLNPVSKKDNKISYLQEIPWFEQIEPPPFTPSTDDVVRLFTKSVADESIDFMTAKWTVLESSISSTVKENIFKNVHCHLKEMDDYVKDHMGKEFSEDGYCDLGEDLTLRLQLILALFHATIQCHLAQDIFKSNMICKSRKGSLLSLQDQFLCMESILAANKHLCPCNRKKIYDSIFNKVTCVSQDISGYLKKHYNHKPTTYQHRHFGVEEIITFLDSLETSHSPATSQHEELRNGGAIVQQAGNQSQKNIPFTQSDNSVKKPDSLLKESIHINDSSIVTGAKVLTQSKCPKRAKTENFQRSGDQKRKTETKAAKEDSEKRAKMGGDCGKRATITRSLLETVPEDTNKRTTVTDLKKERVRDTKRRTELKVASIPSQEMCKGTENNSSSCDSKTLISSKASSEEKNVLKPELSVSSLKLRSSTSSTATNTFSIGFKRQSLSCTSSSSKTSCPGNMKSSYHETSFQSSILSPSRDRSKQVSRPERTCVGKRSREPPRRSHDSVHRKKYAASSKSATHIYDSQSASGNYALGNKLRIKGLKLLGSPHRFNTKLDDTNVNVKVDILHDCSSNEKEPSDHRPNHALQTISSPGNVVVTTMSASDEIRERKTSNQVCDLQQIKSCPSKSSLDSGDACDKIRVNGARNLMSNLQEPDCGLDNAGLALDGASEKIERSKISNRSPDLKQAKRGPENTGIAAEGSYGAIGGIAEPKAVFDVRLTKEYHDNTGLATSNASVKINRSIAHRMVSDIRPAKGGCTDDAVDKIERCKTQNQMSEHGQAKSGSYDTRMATSVSVKVRGSRTSCKDTDLQQPKIGPNDTVVATKSVSDKMRGRRTSNQETDLVLGKFGSDCTSSATYSVSGEIGGSGTSNEMSLHRQTKSDHVNISLATSNVSDKIEGSITSNLDTDLRQAKIGQNDTDVASKSISDKIRGRRSMSTQETDLTGLATSSVSDKIGNSGASNQLTDWEHADKSCLETGHLTDRIGGCRTQNQWSYLEKAEKACDNTGLATYCSADNIRGSRTNYQVSDLETISDKKNTAKGVDADGTAVESIKTAKDSEERKRQKRKPSAVLQKEEQDEVQRAPKQRKCNRIHEIPMEEECFDKATCRKSALGKNTRSSSVKQNQREPKSVKCYKKMRTKMEKPSSAQPHLVQGINDIYKTRDKNFMTLKDSCEFTCEVPDHLKQQKTPKVKLPKAKTSQSKRKPYASIVEVCHESNKNKKLQTTFSEDAARKHKAKWKDHAIARQTESDASATSIGTFSMMVSMKPKGKTKYEVVSIKGDCSQAGDPEQQSKSKLYPAFYKSQRHKLKNHLSKANRSSSKQSMKDQHTTPKVPDKGKDSLSLVDKKCDRHHVDDSPNRDKQTSNLNVGTKRDELEENNPVNKLADKNSVLAAIDQIHRLLLKAQANISSEHKKDPGHESLLREGHSSGSDAHTSLEEVGSRESIHPPKKPLSCSTKETTRIVEDAKGGQIADCWITAVEGQGSDKQTNASSKKIKLCNEKGKENVRFTGLQVDGLVVPQTTNKTEKKSSTSEACPVMREEIHSISTIGTDNSSRKIFNAGDHVITDNTTLSFGKSETNSVTVGASVSLDVQITGDKRASSQKHTPICKQLSIYDDADLEDCPKIVNVKKNERTTITCQGTSNNVPEIKSIVPNSQDLGIVKTRSANELESTTNENSDSEVSMKLSSSNAKELESHSATKCNLGTEGEHCVQNGKTLATNVDQGQDDCSKSTAESSVAKSNSIVVTSPTKVDLLKAFRTAPKDASLISDNEKFLFKPRSLSFKEESLSVSKRHLKGELQQEESGNSVCCSSQNPSQTLGPTKVLEVEGNSFVPKIGDQTQNFPKAGMSKSACPSQQADSSNQFMHFGDNDIEQPFTKQSGNFYCKNFEQSFEYEHQGNPKGWMGENTEWNYGNNNRGRRVLLPLPEEGKVDIDYRMPPFRGGDIRHPRFGRPWNKHNFTRQARGHQIHRRGGNRGGSPRGKFRGRGRASSHSFNGPRPQNFEINGSQPVSSIFCYQNNNTLEQQNFENIGSQSNGNTSFRFPSNNTCEPQNFEINNSQPNGNTNFCFQNNNNIQPSNFENNSSQQPGNPSFGFQNYNSFQSQTPRMDFNNQNGVRPNVPAFGLQPTIPNTDNIWPLPKGPNINFPPFMGFCPAPNTIFQNAFNNN